MNKTKMISLFPLWMALILVGCNGQNVSQDISSFTTNEDSSSAEIVSSSSYVSISEETLPEITPLSEAKLLSKDTPVTVGGVIGKIWIGSTQVVPQGFYLFDEHTTLFVFGPDVAAQVVLGNYVILSGQVTWYIIDTDLNQAEKIGYQGAIQVSLPTLLHNDKTIHPIPLGGIVETTIQAVTKIPVTENITSTLYRSQAKIIRVDGANFRSYYFVDLSLDFQLLLYTSANGNDHRWLDSYLDQIRYVTFIIHNARVADAVWRITPVEVHEETAATTEQLVDFALRRLGEQFEEAYYVSTTLNMLNVDNQVPGATITYISNNTAIVVENGFESASLIIDNKVSTDVQINIRIQYLTVDKSIVIQVKVVSSLPSIKTEDIEIVRSMQPGSEVAVRGILMAFAYYGSTTKQGFYLGDETSQIVVYVTDKTSLERVVPGEMLIVSGILTLSTRFGLSIDNALIAYQDYQTHAYFTDAIETTSLTALLAHVVADNITSRVFRVTVTVEVTTGRYSNVYLHDANNQAVSVILYSTGSANANAVARTLEGQTLDVYMSLISRRYPDGGANDYWRAELLAPAI